MLCTKCNHELPEGSAFCNHCGANLNAEETLTQPEGPITPVPAPPTKPKGFLARKTGKITLIAGAAVLLLVIVLITTLGGGKKEGALSGEVIYFYNNFVGSRGDNDAKVFVFNIDTYAPYPLPFNATQSEPDRGMWLTKVRSDGTYKFESLPVGNYVVLIISEHCKVFGSPDLQDSITSITFDNISFGDYAGKGELYYISMLTAFRKFQVYEPIVISANQTKTVDHDFGMTAY